MNPSLDPRVVTNVRDSKELKQFDDIDSNAVTSKNN